MSTRINSITYIIALPYNYYIPFLSKLHFQSNDVMTHVAMKSLLSKLVVKMIVTCREQYIQGEPTVVQMYGTLFLK